MIAGYRWSLGALVLAVLLAAGSPAAAEPTVEDLVRDLGHPSYAVREKAGRELWQRGRPAIPALEDAATDANPEVARRAREVLDTFGWYIFPDTPPKVLDRIRQFQGGKPDDRKAAFAELLALGPHGRAAVAAILRKDLPADTRDPLTLYLTTLLRRQVPLLLFDGKTGEAAELLALHTIGSTPEGVADYAALQVLRGTLPAALIDAEAAIKSARNPATTNLVLAHLYRADRNWPKARAAAAHFPRQPRVPSLVEMLLEEEGDWAALIQNPPPPPLNHPDALNLTLLRLAGREKEFEEQVRRVRDNGREAGFPLEIQNSAFALLLNNRAVEAGDLLLEKRQHLGLLSEILIARMRYKDALDLIGDQDTPAAHEKLEFDLRRARVLVLTGKRDEAVKLFARVADGLRLVSAPNLADESDTLQARRALLRSELRVGLRDLAAEHAGTFAGDGTSAGYRDRLETVFEILFGTDADAAETAFRALRKRQIPGPEPGPTMLRVRHLLAGTAAPADTDQAIRVLASDDPTERAPPGVVNTAGDQRRVARLTALAAVCRAARRFTEAETALVAAAELATDGPGPLGARSWVFGTSDASRPWLELGELLDDRGRFRDAAAQFETGWKRFPDQPLLLFLAGKAFVKAGQPEEGRRRMELAHWVALGNERVRGKFLEELIRRGEGKAARRETDLLLHCCWSRDTYFGNVMNQAGRAAAMNHEWATAERCLQRSVLVLIKNPGYQYVDLASYLTVPHEMFAHRARGLLAAGKVEEAMALARACLDVMPGNTQLVSGMVPDLERLGRQREADELFGRTWAAYQRVLTDYPNSPTARNALATLGANCRRELDRSLGYANEAVAADRPSATFRETLAEVYFRRGDRVAAREVMTGLAAEFPRSRLYQRQLKRYKSGDVASPIPETEDE